MADKQYDFSTVQIQVPGQIRKKFLEIGPKFIKKSDLAKGEKGYEDSPHITILYGLHDQKPSLELIDLIESYPKFTVQLGNISLFKSSENNKPFDVVKVDVKSSDLHVLNSAIRECCAHTTEFPDYKPHITLAYITPDCCDDLDGNPAFRGLSFVVDSVIFASRDGNKREISFGQK